MNLILKWLSWNLINIFDRNISSSFHGWKYTLSKAMYALSEPPRALISAIYRPGDKLGPHQNQCMTTSTRVIRTKVWSLNHPKSMGFSICILPPTWIVWANQRALAVCEVVNHCFVLMLLCLSCLIMLLQGGFLTGPSLNLLSKRLKKHCQRHYGPRRWLLWPVILVW